MAKLKSSKSPRRRKAINGVMLDISAASALYGPSERSLWGLVANGAVPARKLGGRVVFLRSELDQFFSTLPGISVAEARANEKARRK